MNVRDLDGEPWTVAAVAGAQALHAIEEAVRATADFEWAARGSWMSQEAHRTGDMPTGEDFQAAPLGQQLEASVLALVSTHKRIKTSTTAASYDPRSY